MKKLLLIALILFTTLVYSQKPKVSAVRYTAVTTIERDAFVVPAGEFWRIHNSTTAQNEYWDGDSWEPLSISEATFNLNSKNYSWGESYIENWGKSVLDLGATYFPNNGGYEIGRLHQLGLIPSLHFIPAAVKEAVLYSIGKNRTNDLTVDRNSIATYVDEDRIIQTAAIDVARIDYTDGDGAILIEPQSTNLVLWSEEFDNGSYGKVNVTVNADASVSPDGNTTMDKIIETAVTSFHRIFQSINRTSGQDYTISVFAKKGERHLLYLNGEEYNDSRAVFDLNLGTILDNGGGTSEIKDFGNGIYRCSVTGTATGTGNANVHFQINNTKEVLGNDSYLGDGTSGLYLWGFKVATDDSSYIKTEATTVTRLADLISGAGDVNTFNSEEGVLFVEFSALSDDLTEREINLSDGSNTNRVIIRYHSVSNSIQYILVSASSTQVQKNFVVSDITELNKVAVRWALNDFSLWINGVEVGTDSSGNTFPLNTLSTLNFTDGSGSGTPFYGKVKDLKVLPYLTDEEMILLTKMFGFMFLCRIRRKETEYKIAA